MFCPLCKAEFREGFTRCAECNAELMDEPAPDSSDPVPHASLWSGSDPVMAEEICRTLSEAQIPFQRPERHNLAVGSFYPVPLGLDAVALEILVPETHLSKAQALIEPLPKQTPTLRCPLCNAEHSPDSRECSDCGLPLVRSAAELWSNPPVLLWCGHKSRRSANLVEALSNARIQFLPLQIHTGRHPIGQDILIIVRRNDFRAAFEVLVSTLNEPDYDMHALVTLLGLSGCVVDGFFPADGIAVEVWAGPSKSEEESPGKILNQEGIDFVIVGRWMWFVAPGEEERAHELIRASLPTRLFEGVET